jgi:hypothetical protein
VSTFIGSRRYRRCFAMTMCPDVVGWDGFWIPQCSESSWHPSSWLAEGTYSKRALFLQRVCASSQRVARGPVSDSWRMFRKARLGPFSSGHALLAGMRLAASMRAARAGSPRSSKSSRAARCSNRVAPCGRASLRAALMSARRASGSARAGPFGLLGGGQQPREDGVVAQEPSVQRTRSPTAGTASG